MNKKKYLIIFVVFILLLIVFEVFIKIDSPSFFDEKIKELKNDSLLMKDIGGFRKYEYFYNENQLESDTLKFKITVIRLKSKVP